MSDLHYQSAHFKYVWFMVCQLYLHKAVIYVYIYICMQWGKSRRMMCLCVGLIKEKFVWWEPHSQSDP